MKRYFTLGIMAWIALGWTPHVRAQCTRDVDCPGKQICSGGRCTNPAPAASGACTKDTDCPGNQVCQSGRCASPLTTPSTDPPPAAAPPAAAPDTAPPSAAPSAAPPSAAPPSGAPPSSASKSLFFSRFYGNISVIIGAKTWGEIELDESGLSGSVDVDAKGIPGVHLSAYYVLNPYFHIGGFFHYANGEHKLKDDGTTLTENDVEDWGIGFSAKFGGQAGSRFWIGGAFDLGFCQLHWDEDGGNGVGNAPIIFPRFLTDLQAFRIGSVKMGLTLGIGAQALPIVKGKGDFGSGHGLKFKGWTVRLAIQIGVNVGL